jgi:hypothetical protein
VTKVHVRGGGQDGNVARFGIDVFHLGELSEIGNSFLTDRDTDGGDSWTMLVLEFMIDLSL